MAFHQSRPLSEREKGRAESIDYRNSDVLHRCTRWATFMVYPLTFRFLSTYQLSSEVENISLNSYIDNFMMLMLCMGLAFELPLVTWLLSLMGVVTRPSCGNTAVMRLSS